MQSISIREFNKNISGYLEEAFSGEEIRITKRGESYITLSRTSNVATTNNKYPKTVVEVATMLPKSSYLEYGCGCPKGVENLCPKHGRV